MTLFFVTIKPNSPRELLVFKHFVVLASTKEEAEQIAKRETAHEAESRLTEIVQPGRSIISNIFLR